MEKQSKKILSLPVLSLDEGEHLGYVKNLVIDPGLKAIVAFVINQKGWFKEDKIIPFNRVRNIGDNAIVIDKSGTAEKPANFPQIIKLMKSPARIINSKVVSTSGKALGHVEEFYFDITGKITRLELSGKFTDGLWKGKTLLSSEEVITIGKDAIIVKEGAESRIVSEGSKPLQKTMLDLKAATVKAWDTTVQTSQKLGQAITNSISKLAEEEKDARQNKSEQKYSDNLTPAPTYNEDNEINKKPPCQEIPEKNQELCPPMDADQTDNIKVIPEENKEIKE